MSGATDVYWSTELEELHEESSRTHFLDVATMAAVVGALGRTSADARIADFGCSSGFLMERLSEVVPQDRLVGVDYVFAGLVVARSNVPAASLLNGDAGALPFRDSSFDAITSANMLEHVPDDIGALREIYRALKPGGRAVLVVPAGPTCYDYYDRFLHHQRRYARSELSDKALGVGFRVLDRFSLGWMIFPAFWLVKQRNRRFRSHLAGQQLTDQVTRDIGKTKDSAIGNLTRRAEATLRRWHLRPAFGIRHVVVLERPRGRDGRP